MKNIFVAIALSLSLCACIHVASPPVHTQTTVSADPIVIPPVAYPIIPNPVQWKVYNAAELKALGAELTANGGNVALFTLDSPNFKNLSDNLVDIKKYIEQQNAVILFLTKVANLPATDAQAANAANGKK